MVQIGTIDAILRGKYFFPDPVTKQIISVNLNKNEMAKTAIGSST